jgi:hypothetical protein
LLEERILPLKVKGLSICLLLRTKFNRDEVLYILDCTKKLLYVGKLTNKGIVLIFDDKKCLFLTKPCRKIITCGVHDPKNGLYKMKETMVPSTPIPMIFLVEGMFNLAWLWH